MWPGNLTNRSQGQSSHALPPGQVSQRGLRDLQLTDPTGEVTTEALGQPSTGLGFLESFSLATLRMWLRGRCLHESVSLSCAVSWNLPPLAAGLCATACVPRDSLPLRPCGVAASGVRLPALPLASSETEALGKLPE